jgi:hypothetical protein
MYVGEEESLAKIIDFTDFAPQVINATAWAEFEKRMRRGRELASAGSSQQKLAEEWDSEVSLSAQAANIPGIDPKNFLLGAKIKLL